MPQFSARKLVSLLSSAALIATFVVTSLPAAASAATCTPTGFMRDGINMTAAQIGGNVTGTLDATGCNIGVYYDSSSPAGNVNAADIFGANYFGVVVNGASVNLTGSQVHAIGELPLNGSQHGNAIVYINGASGTISGNAVFSYQKNGITVSGKSANGVDAGTVVTSASVTNNVVTGEGPVTYIAQNGIQISFGATAKLFGNDVSLNDYTPPKVTSCGLLIYKAGGVSGASKNGISFIKADNDFHDNETDICNFGKGGGFSL